MRKLEAKAAQLKIQPININPRLCEITFEGLPDDVSHMTDIIIKELHAIENRTRLKTEADLYRQTVQWYHTDVNDANNKESLVKFIPDINMVINFEYMYVCCRFFQI